MSDRISVITKAICKSAKFESGHGTCAFLCMSGLGDVRRSGCAYHHQIHGDMAKQIADALDKVSGSTPDLVHALSGLLAANDAVQMVLCDGPEVPDFDPTALGKAQVKVTAAEDVARKALRMAGAS